VSTEPGRRGPALEDLAATLRDRLIDSATGDGDLRARVHEIVAREAGVLGQSDRDELERLIERGAIGLGPLEPLLADPGVDEVMVNGPAEVWVERAGRLERAPVRFDDEGALRHAIERILAPLGRRVDEAEPMCDARLPDGSRVNVVIAPLALEGPVLTIRRFRRRGFTPDELVGLGTWTAPLRDMLEQALGARLNLLVSGGTGSGKTTTLNALSSFIPPGERIVTIEDAAELRLQQPHVVRLEARPASLEGRGEVTIRRLVRNALRMRPDRIVVGEVRGGEVVDLLAALNTGHDGGAGTVHANRPAEVPARLEALAAAGGMDRAALHSQLAAAVRVILHVGRNRAGRRLEEIAVLHRGDDGLVSAITAWHADLGFDRGMDRLADALTSRRPS
jgi:pilus assembly protein CpaF